MIRRISLIVLLLVHGESFSQIEFVYANQTSGERLSELLDKKLVRIDSNSIERSRNVRHLTLAFEKYSDATVFENHPKFCSNIKALVISCLLPANFYLFHTVKRFVVLPGLELCNNVSDDDKIGDLTPLLDSKVMALKNVKYVSVYNYNDVFIFEHLGSLPKLNELDLFSHYYPFSVVTNNSVRKIGALTSYPEFEMFKQLGFKCDYFPSFGISEVEREEYLYDSKTCPIYKLKEGVNKLHYKTGQQLLEGTIENGKLHGEWKLWFGNGQQSELRSYSNGKANGTWIMFSPTGDTLQKLNFENGKFLNSVEYTRTEKNVVIKELSGYGTGEIHRKQLTIRNHPRGDSRVNEEYQGDSLINYYSYTISDGVLRHEYTFLGLNDSNENMFVESLYFENGKLMSQAYILEFAVQRRTSSVITRDYHGSVKKWSSEGELIENLYYEKGIPIKNE